MTWTDDRDEDPIDIFRCSFVRLREMAFRRYDEAIDGSLVESYWNEYMRALEHIIEMEDE